jgi:hypothetical protein
LFPDNPSRFRSRKAKITDETVLKIVTFRFRQRPIARGRNRLGAVGKTPERNSHQRYVALGSIGVPHAIAICFRTHQHVQKMILTLQKRKLIHRTA